MYVFTMIITIFLLLLTIRGIVFTYDGSETRLKTITIFTLSYAISSYVFGFVWVFFLNGHKAVFLYRDVLGLNFADSNIVKWLYVSCFGFSGCVFYKSLNVYDIKMLFGFANLLGTAILNYGIYKSDYIAERLWEGNDSSRDTENPGDEYVRPVVYRVLFLAFQLIIIFNVFRVLW